jgi:YVTN family beta-propeller protein
MGIGFKRNARALLVGSLVLGGAITASVVIGAPTADAAVVVQTIGVGSLPVAVSSDGTHVWVANQGGNTVTELNASTGAVVQTIGVGDFPDAVSSDGTHVWVANAGGNTMTEIFVNPPFQVATTPLPPATPGTAYGPVTLQVLGAGVSTPPYTTKLKWRAIELPKGLKLSSTGVLSGTPIAKLHPGTLLVGVQVTGSWTIVNDYTKTKP